MSNKSENGAKTWAQASGTYLTFFQTPADNLRRRLLDPLIFELTRPEGKMILDLGCGEGYLSRLLKRSYPKKVVGADIAEDLLTEARRLDPEGEYRKFDLTVDPVFSANSFDVVICNMVMMDLSDLRSAFDKINDFLTDSGVLICTVLNPYYAYPVGIWKKDLREIIHGRFDPILRITDYFGNLIHKKRLHSQVEEVPHYHWKFAEYVNYAKESGFILETLQEPQISRALANEYPSVFLTEQLQKVPLFFVLKYIKK